MFVFLFTLLLMQRAAAIRYTAVVPTEQYTTQYATQRLVYNYMLVYTLQSATRYSVE